jgi:hypothetical protein
MIIKTNDFELEIFQGSEVYLGSKKRGQTFKKWSEMDENIRVGLESIMKQTESLLKTSEELLLAPVKF